MPNILPQKDNTLLSICALLRWFDYDIIRALIGEDGAEIEALIASNLVTPVTTLNAAYQLREGIRVETLAHLRSEHPSHELTLHQRIFDYFLQQLQESASDNRREMSEDSVLYHLSQLFLLIAARQDWHTLTKYVEAARSIHPQQARLSDWLSFYQGFVRIRTQDYELGESTLSTLLAQSNLENELRLQALNALGQAYYFQARYEHALALYQKVHTLACEIGNRMYQGFALGNMSNIYEELSYYEQALDMHIQSLQLFRELGDRNHEARALYQIGKYALQQGRWQVAQSHFQQAIELHEVLHIPSRLAYLHWGQGFLFHMLGDETASEAAYRRAHAIAETQEYGQPDLALDIHFQLGFLYQTQGRWDEALAAYDRALALAHQLHSRYSAIFIHYRRGSIFARQGQLDAAFADYAWAIDGIEQLRGAHETEEIKIGLLGTAQQVYESMVLLCLALDRPAEAFHYVERARSRAFLDLLAKKQALADPALYDALAQPVARLTEVQAQLGADALLLEYFTIGVVPRGENLINMLPPENARVREHLTLAPQVLIFAITHERMQIFSPALNPNTLRPQPGDPGPSGRLLRDRLLTHLHEQLIAPVAALLHGREQLYLIPHGPLHYVPFMALRSAAGEHLLASDGPAIALAPSATVLLRNCLNRPPTQTKHALPLLALGYNDQGEEALRYAEAEANHVARMLGGQAWIGAAPKSPRLLAEGRGARWLHIAGHAVYDPHDPLGSYLRLGDGDTLSARAMIGGLDLAAELVTLSACMSGLNHVVFGDELMGLQRALLYAGAPTVVCTLWEASDLVALVVMDHFYTDLQRGQPPAAALRDAQVAARTITGRGLLATIERWRASDPAFVAALGELPEVPADELDRAIYPEPFYWAPFMLIGKPR